MSRSVFSLALAGLAVITQLTSAQIDFECPEADGLFAHPEQCDRYFECRNFRVKRKLCADGLVFDPNKVLSEEPCDHQQNTKHKCRGKPKLQPPKPGDRYCPRQNGVFPSPDVTECDKFYSCLNGVGKVQQVTKITANIIDAEFNLKPFSDIYEHFVSSECDPTEKPEGIPQVQLYSVI